MNITSVNRILISLVALILCVQVFVRAQPKDTTSGNYAFSIEAMGGLSYNLKEDNFKSKKLDLSPSIRILWRPNHRLNFGIEITDLVVRRSDYEKNKEKLQARLEAVPVYLVFNMNLLSLDFTGGIGASYMKSTIEAFNDQAISTNWHYCFNFGLGYSYYLSKSFGAGIEGKFFSLTKTDEIVGGVYLKIIYKINY